MTGEGKMENPLSAQLVATGLEIQGRDEKPEIRRRQMYNQLDGLAKAAALAIKFDQAIEVLLEGNEDDEPRKTSKLREITKLRKSLDNYNLREVEKVKLESLLGALYGSWEDEIMPDDVDEVTEIRRQLKEFFDDYEPSYCNDPEYNPGSDFLSDLPDADENGIIRWPNLEEDRKKIITTISDLESQKQKLNIDFNKELDRIIEIFPKAQG